MLVIRKKITKEDLLDRISEEAIFMAFLGFFSWTKSYCNPLRPDRKPGCKFRLSNGRIYFYDFSTGIRYDCFDVIMHQYKIDFGQALEMVERHFYNKAKIIVPPRPTFTPIQVEVEDKPWESNDKKFWSKYYLDDSILIGLYQTTPLRQLKENGNIKYSYGFGSIAFYWRIEQEYKFYFPTFTNKSRHYSSSMVLGFSQLAKADHLVITKSMKDVMVLRKLGINAVSPTSETVLFGKDMMVYLRERYPRIFTLLDNDRTGKKFTIKWRMHYNTTPMLLPKGQKDISDRTVAFGYRSVNEMVESVANYYGITRLTNL